MERTPRLPSGMLGALAVACYGLHAMVYLARDEPHHLLWMCHVGALLVGMGLIFQSPIVNAIGLLWTCFGTPLWILYLATGGEWLPTSLLTHAAGIILGVVGVRRFGHPHRAALKATAAFVPLWAITRALTPAAANVNVAFSVYQGWEDWFTSYPPYFVMLLAIGFVTFTITEQLLVVLFRTDRAPALTVQRDGPQV